MAKKNKLSVDSFQAYQNELEYLRTVSTLEVAEQLKVARSFGDLSENSEYDEARNDQAKLYGRIAELEQLLANAEVIEERPDGKGNVSIGGTVKLKDVDSGDVFVYGIVGTRDADPTLGKISEESPVGKAIIGKLPGDIVTVEAPFGTMQLEILSFEK